MPCPLKLSANMPKPVPKDAVAIESKGRNYVFFIDENRYIKYYEGPDGGNEGPDHPYEIKSLKRAAKNILVSKDVTQLAVVAYKDGNKHEASTILITAVTVSYTHLTLPTKRIV